MTELEELQQDAAEANRFAILKRAEAAEANRVAIEKSKLFAAALDAKLNDRNNGKAT